MPVKVNAVRDGGGSVEFGYDRPGEKIHVSCGATPEGTVASLSGQIACWPELRGRTVTMDFNAKTGVVRVMYQDPFYFDASGNRIDPPRAIVYETCLKLE